MNIVDILPGTEMYRVADADADLPIVPHVLRFMEYAWGHLLIEHETGAIDSIDATGKW